MEMDRIRESRKKRQQPPLDRRCRTTHSLTHSLTHYARSALHRDQRRPLFAIVVISGDEGDAHLSIMFEAVTSVNNRTGPLTLLHLALLPDFYN